MEFAEFLFSKMAQEQGLLGGNTVKRDILYREAYKYATEVSSFRGDCHRTLLQGDVSQSIYIRNARNRVRYFEHGYEVYDKGDA